MYVCMDESAFTEMMPSIYPHKTYLDMYLWQTAGGAPFFFFLFFFYGVRSVRQAAK